MNTLTLSRDVRREKGKCISTAGCTNRRVLGCSQSHPPETKKKVRLCIKGCWALGNLKEPTGQKAINNCPRPFFSLEISPLTSHVPVLCLLLTICSSTTLNQNAIKKDNLTQREALDTLDLKKFIQMKKYCVCFLNSVKWILTQKLKKRELWGFPRLTCPHKC